MKLKHITFTGIDARTDVQELKTIQEQYPIVEFGVLTSYHWYENGNRYLDPELLGRLYGRGLKLALHVCGQAAHDAAGGLWNKINRLTAERLYQKLFGRVQLNVATRKDNPAHMASTPPNTNYAELIIQQQPGDTSLYENSRWLGKGNVSMLLDASGGQGIDTPVVPWTKGGKVGYAGGINPDNVADKLSYLLSHPDVGDFWIDVESGVRTDDWFDLDKVRRVLAICTEVMRDLHMED